MYDPKKKCSFYMQFGYKSPNWQPKHVSRYIKKADRIKECDKNK